MQVCPASHNALKMPFNLRTDLRNFDGIGVQAAVAADLNSNGLIETSEIQVKELSTGTWRCQNESALYFGLKHCAKIDWVLVTWPDKTTQKLDDIAVHSSGFTELTFAKSDTPECDVEDIEIADDTAIIDFGDCTMYQQICDEPDATSFQYYFTVNNTSTGTSDAAKMSVKIGMAEPDTMTDLIEKTLGQFSFSTDLENWETELSFTLGANGTQNVFVRFIPRTTLEEYQSIKSTFFEDGAEEGDADAPKPLLPVLLETNEDASTRYTSLVTLKGYGVPDTDGDGLSDAVDPDDDNDGLADDFDAYSLSADADANGVSDLLQQELTGGYYINFAPDSVNPDDYFVSGYDLCTLTTISDTTDAYGWVSTDTADLPESYGFDTITNAIDRVNNTWFENDSSEGFMPALKLSPGVYDYSLVYAIDDGQGVFEQQVISKVMDNSIDGWATFGHGGDYDDNNDGYFPVVATGTDLRVYALRVIPRKYYFNMRFSQDYSEVPLGFTVAYDDLYPSSPVISSYGFTDQNISVRQNVTDCVTVTPMSHGNEIYQDFKVKLPKGSYAGSMLLFKEESMIEDPVVLIGKEVNGSFSGSMIRSDQISVKPDGEIDLERQMPISFSFTSSNSEEITFRFQGEVYLYNLKIWPQVSVVNFQPEDSMELEYVDADTGTEIGDNYYGWDSVTNISALTVVNNLFRDTFADTANNHEWTMKGMRRGEYEVTTCGVLDDIDYSIDNWTSSTDISRQFSISCSDEFDFSLKMMNDNARISYIIFRDTTVDSDGDGLSDALEILYGTDENLYDTDGDELSDFDEIYYYENWEFPAGYSKMTTKLDIGTIANDRDCDDDGVLDGADGLRDTDGDGYYDAFDSDSDNDFLMDGTESGITSCGSDTNTTAAPIGLSTRLEISFTIATSYIPDTDGLSTTSPKNFDTDGDGFRDGPDVTYAGTNTTRFGEDLDGDGQLDTGETDPNDLESKPNCPIAMFDADGDGIPDTVEDANDNGIYDEEDMSNYLDSDTDDDGLSDGTELGITEKVLGPDGLEDGIAGGNGGWTPNDGTYVNIAELSDQPDTPQYDFVDKEGNAVLRYCYVPDADDVHNTNVFVDDTDHDGIKDGDEDLNANGMVDASEEDPSFGFVVSSGSTGKFSGNSLFLDIGNRDDIAIGIVPYYEIKYEASFCFSFGSKDASEVQSVKIHVDDLSFIRSTPEILNNITGSNQMVKLMFNTGAFAKTIDASIELNPEKKNFPGSKKVNVDFPLCIKIPNRIPFPEGSIRDFYEKNRYIVAPATNDYWLIDEPDTFSIYKAQMRKNNSRPSDLSLIYSEGDWKFGKILIVREDPSLDNPTGSFINDHQGVTSNFFDEINVHNWITMLETAGFIVEYINVKNYDKEVNKSKIKELGKAVSDPNNDYILCIDLGHGLQTSDGHVHATFLNTRLSDIWQQVVPGTSKVLPDQRCHFELIYNLSCNGWEDNICGPKFYAERSLCYAFSSMAYYGISKPGVTVQSYAIPMKYGFLGDFISFQMETRIPLTLKVYSDFVQFR